ncbi:Rnf17 [Columba livia]|nr:Rnf17 [Columba livia]
MSHRTATQQCLNQFPGERLSKDRGIFAKVNIPPEMLIGMFSPPGNTLKLKPYFSDAMKEIYDQIMALISASIVAYSAQLLTLTDPKVKSDTIMSRKKDLLLADSNEELNRRKMRAIRQCLKILEEDFTEPYQINSDLCPMSKVLHDDVEDEDTDVIGFSSTETKTDFKLGLRSGNSRRLASPFRPSTEEKKVQHRVSSNGGLRDKPALALSGDMDSKTVEEIDGALYVAICNLSHLHDADEVICNLKLSVDTEVSRVNSLKEEISPSEDNGQRTLTLDDKEEVLSCDTQSSVGNMSLALSRESKIKALANKLGVHKEVKNTQDQKTLPMLCQQSIPALPKSPSSPDVIIEEIFEDDLEKQTEFPTECHADEQRKKLFNKETPFQHKAGSAELVFVSHVINPCHFYIRRYSQMKEAGVLEKKLKKLCCSKSSYLLSSDVLELGARAFIKSKETEMWCRGTITKLIPLKSKNKRKPCGPVRYKVCDIALLEVFLIDFGSSVVLTSSGYIHAERPEPATLQTIETDDFSLFVRKPNQHIEAELAAVPPLAVRCSLKDVVPKNASEGWGEEAKTKFLGMVNNKVVLMTIFREEDGVLIVDLKKPPFNKTNNNMPVSLKDALVFLDLARFRSQLPSESENNTILQYSPPKIPQEREVISVVVCHINSPSDFYLQLRDNLDSLYLPKKIQEEYKHEDEKNLKIVCPVEGQACIAKQSDGNWYRAQIIGLPSHEEVMVKYVDFGNIGNITLKDIRRVKKEFLSFPEKAFRCRLAFIEPYKGESEWNRKAKERFEEITKDKLMLCLVVEILDNNILSVELFDSSAVHARSFSINLQLVKEDLASSYIRGSTENTAVRPNEIWDVPLVGIPETSEALNSSDMESVDEGDFKSLCKKELQESDVAWTLPVKIICRDETGRLIDISEHLIKMGLAFRNRRTDKAAVACSDSKEHLKACLEQENTQLDGCNSKTACARNSVAPEENVTVSGIEQKSRETNKALLHSGMDEIYKSPIIPEAKIFQAVVSHVGHDGTIYIVPKSFETELNKLMTEIQSNFKCLGLLEPYCWKKGEACVVRGSDTMWYRGKVVEVCGSTLQVQYIDHGCIEKIPQCHLYPTTLYTGIPPFCIPCQLYKTVPELPDNPWGKLSINLYCGGMSLSSFMAYQKYCVVEDGQDISELELIEGDVSDSPSYTLPPLPDPGDIFPVRVTHLVSPKEVYICFEPSESPLPPSAPEGDASCDSELESLEEALKWCNKCVESFPLVTHFQTGMPCLVEYQDGFWYRAKLLSVEEFDPVKILVQFVDYGNFSVVPASRLRHVPYHLLKYPVQAVRALLAGFKPALYDEEKKRIPYSPEWSVEALWAMMECVEGKQLSASILAVSPEVTISLYGDDQNLVHMKLIEMGLADLDE